MRYRKKLQRRGVASVELAFVVLFFFIPVLFGIWEAGRLIEVQQIVSKSAREGARLAAQGYTINATGAPTQIMAQSGSPNVHDTVYQYLIAAGFTNLQRSDVAVTFAFTDSPNPDPYMGNKNEPFTVAVSVPWNKVRWVNVGLINPTQVKFTATWQMLVDDAFNVNQSMPSL
ncbi:MAG TPA: TadE family protein [Urbifossiella sp.]|nr:TadE family protein [Urbifossiella sp.]